MHFLALKNAKWAFFKEPIPLLRLLTVPSVLFIVQYNCFFPFIRRAHNYSELCSFSPTARFQTLQLAALMIGNPTVAPETTNKQDMTNELANCRCYMQSFFTVPTIELEKSAVCFDISIP